MTTKSEAAKQAASRSLFKIGEDFGALYALMIETEEDLGDEQTAALEEFFDGLKEERDHKIDAYVAIITELTGAADVMDREIERIKRLSAQRRNRAKYLTDRLKTFLEIYGEKDEDGHYLPAGFLRVVRVQNNPSRPVLLHLRYEADPSELPEDYRRVTFSADRKALAEDLLAVEALVRQIEEGDDSEETRKNFEARRKVLQVASFGERGTHLRIT